MEDPFSDDVPRSVGEARVRFNLIADCALARRLQDEEFRGHFSSNKQERQLVGSDAKASHNDILHEIMEQEALRRENIKQALMLDEEMAGRLQRKFDGEAILSKLLAKNQAESDARLARELHEQERNRLALYSRRPYPIIYSRSDSDEERPPTPPPHRRPLAHVRF